jgi:integrase
VSLKEAREKRDAFKRDLANGIDPRAPKPEIATFETVAREWYEKYVVEHSISYAKNVLYRLEHYLFPRLGKCPIKDIKASELLDVLRVVEGRGTINTAHCTKQAAGAIFRYGIAIGACEHDISADLKGALQPVRRPIHRAALTAPADIAELLRAMDASEGTITVRLALWFSLYTFQRPGEIRRAEWKEVDWDKSEWRIPPEKMKMKRLHIVPLSRQALRILQELRPVTGHERYVFPNIRNGNRPMSGNTLAAALRRLGYAEDQMCPHGFRSMASTNLNEQDWPSDVIERQLAHVEGNAVRAAYNHAEYLPERRKMMQAWADWLDSLNG